MNKRQQCEALYEELTAEGYVLPEGKSLRATFIETAVTKFGMTEKGAGTYYVNAKAKAEGRAKPEYHRKQETSAEEQSSKWSIAKIENGAVTVVWQHDTEEKARAEFDQLRPENREACVVVPGVVRVGELVNV